MPPLRFVLCLPERCRLRWKQACSAMAARHLLISVWCGSIVWWGVSWVGLNAGEAFKHGALVPAGTATSGPAWRVAQKGAPVGPRSTKPTKVERRVAPPTFDQATLKLFQSEPAWLKRELPAWSNLVGEGSGPGTSDFGPASEAGSSGEVAWPISAEQLEDEVKAIAERLETGSPGQVAADELVLLAQWFQIIAEYPQEVRWKNLAKDATKTFASLAQQTATPASGKKALAEAQRVLQDLIRTGTADLKSETKQGAELLEDLGPLMRRLELAQRQYVGNSLSAAKTFNNEQDRIVHEAAVMAALSRLIQADAFGFATEESYTGYAAQMLAASNELRITAEAGNRDAAQEAQATIEKQCSACHAEYKN